MKTQKKMFQVSIPQISKRLSVKDFICLGHLVFCAESGLLTFLAVVLHLQTCNELKIQK